MKDLKACTDIELWDEVEARKQKKLKPKKPEPDYTKYYDEAAEISEIARETQVKVKFSSFSEYIPVSWVLKLNKDSEVLILPEPQFTLTEIMNNLYNPPKPWEEDIEKATRNSFNKLNKRVEKLVTRIVQEQGLSRKKAAALVREAISY